MLGLLGVPKGMAWRTRGIATSGCRTVINDTIKLAANAAQIRAAPQLNQLANTAPVIGARNCTYYCESIRTANLSQREGRVRTIDGGEKQ